jgi:hypothetical protein
LADAMSADTQTTTTTAAAVRRDRRFMGLLLWLGIDKTATLYARLSGESTVIFFRQLFAGS